MYTYINMNVVEVIIIIIVPMIIVFSQEDVINN